MQTKYIFLSQTGRPSLLRKLATVVGMVVLGVVALMFSAVLLVVVLFIVVFGGAYLWWKTRAVRKMMREMQSHAARNAKAENDAFRGEVFEGEVIEGEVIEVVAVRVQESDVRR